MSAYRPQYDEGAINNRIGIFENALQYVLSPGPEDIVDYGRLDKILAPLIDSFMHWRPMADKFILRFGKVGKVGKA